MSIIELKGLRTVPDIVHEYTPSIKGSAVPLIIDNGIDESTNAVNKSGSIWCVLLDSQARTSVALAGHAMRRH